MLITVLALSPYLSAPVVAISVTSMRLLLALIWVSNSSMRLLLLSELSESSSPASAIAVIEDTDIEGSFQTRLTSELSPALIVPTSVLPM